MRTEIIEITRDMPEWGAVKRAAEIISAGGIVCFPTDTVYGFAASVFSGRAIARLRKLKGRRAGDPFVIIVDDVGWVSELAGSFTKEHRRLMTEHWPGPVTIIFEASASMPACVKSGRDTVALRVPNDTLTQCLLRACGVPLAAPSANPSGKPPAVTPGEVLEHFGGKIDLLLDGGPIESAQPSTIIEVRAGRVVVLREGRVPMTGRAV